MLEFIYLFGVQPTMGKVRSEYLGNLQHRANNACCKTFQAIDKALHPVLWMENLTEGVN